MYVYMHETENDNSCIAVKLERLVSSEIDLVQAYMSHPFPHPQPTYSYA